jgi:hypothetical protein
MGTLLSAIGRSQAIPQFLEQARLARKDEAGIALEQEKMGLLRNQDRRAEIAAEGQNALTAEQLRIEKVKAQEVERVKAEGDRLVTVGKAQENLPSKGMSNAMINDLRRRGHLIEEGVAEPSVTQRNLDAYAKRINMKSDTYDPIAAHEAASSHLTSTRSYLDTMKQAASDPKIFKAMQEQLPDLKNIKFEEMPGLVKDAQSEYEAANNVFYNITEKDKIMRQEAADKQIEMVRHNKEVEMALKSQANAANIRAGADVTKANAAETKVGQKKSPQLSVTEYKTIKEDMDGYEDKTPSEKAILNELAIQNGMVITKRKIAKKGLTGRSREVVYEPKPMSSFKTPNDVK